VNTSQKTLLAPGLCVILAAGCGSMTVYPSSKNTPAETATIDPDRYS
jgi:hypothetical protein